MKIKIKVKMQEEEREEEEEEEEEKREEGARPSLLPLHVLPQQLGLKRRDHERARGIGIGGRCCVNLLCCSRGCKTVLHDVSKSQVSSSLTAREG